MVDKPELGARLRVLRAWKGWTLAEIESATGIGQSVISRWERGQGKEYPDLRRLELVARQYGVKVSDLLDPDRDTRVWLKPAA